MVIARCAASGLLGIALSVHAAALPAGRVGDTATADVVTPVQLIVVDRAATEALKQREAAKVPVIFRFNTNAADQAAAEFSKAVLNLRADFLDALREAYPVTKVTARNLNSQRFRGVTASFRSGHAEFPFSTNLARAWALGADDQEFFQPFADKLREVLQPPLRGTNLPAGLKLGPQVRLVPMPDADTPLRLADAETAGKLTARTNVLLVQDARQDFPKLFPADQHAMARFAAGFIRENCLPEAALTRQAQAQRTDPLHVADRFEPGELVVKRGQVLDEKALAALALLREKIAVGNLQQEVASAQTQATRLTRQNAWLLGSVAGLSIALLLLALHLVRRRQTLALVPVRVGNQEKLLLVPDSTPSAAAVVETASAPEGFAAALARVLGTRLVQRLFAQRKGLMETQQLASAELAEMEDRLAQVHAPLCDRLEAYEKRIAELEQQLARKGAENRELLKAKIDLTRQQLESERARNRTEFN